jgi:hypothetical protein
MRQLHQRINPSESFVPVLSFNLPWEYFVNKLHLSDPERGADDLDDYEAVLLETGGQRFLLLRYARNPKDMVNVLIPSALVTSAQFVDRILRELDVPGDAITRHR